MSRTRESSGPAMRRALITVGRYVWLPTLVLLVIDLSVPEEHSVLRGWGDSQNYTFTHNETYDDGQGEHIYFGLDGIGTANTDTSPVREAVSLGAWSGEFEASVTGEADPACWSPVSFTADLSQSKDQVFGSGKYRVEPASCSTFGEEHEVFVTLFGERRGGRVSLRMRDAMTGDLLMRFDGLIMPRRLSGWFYAPDSRPASGPVTLQPASK